MREFLLTALAATIILASGALGHRAEAITLSKPAAWDASGARAALVQQVVNVCGTNGCALVQTKRVQHTKPGSVAAKHI